MATDPTGTGDIFVDGTTTGTHLTALGNQVNQFAVDKFSWLQVMLQRLFGGDYATQPSADSDGEIDVFLNKLGDIIAEPIDIDALNKNINALFAQFAKNNGEPTPQNIFESTAAVPDTRDVPDFTGTVPSWDTIPDTLTNTAVKIDSLSVPGAQAPQSLFGDIGSVYVPDLQNVLRAINIPNAPVEPNIEGNMPAAIAFRDIAIPSLPPIDLSMAWEGVRPCAADMFPIPDFSYVETDYISALTNSLTDWLTAKIMEGGTGLEPYVEQAIFDRARNRKRAANEKAYNEATSYFASRGYKLPPGQLQARLADVRAEILRTDSDLSSDIMAKQAELAQEMQKFIITSTIQVEGATREFVTRQAQRRLDYARGRVEMAIATEKILEERYLMKVEGWKAEATVFETYIRAQILKLEPYKAALEGGKLDAQAQGILAEFYRNSMAGITALIDLYRARSQGAEAAGAMERLKIEEFQAYIAGHASKISTVAQTIQLKDLNIKNDSAKVGLYEAVLKGASVGLDRLKAQSQLQTEDVARQKEIILAKLARLQADIETFKEIIAVYTAQTDAVSKIYSVDVDKYKAITSSHNTYDENLVKQFGVQAELYKSKIELLEKQIDVQLQVLLSGSKISADYAAEGAKVYAQMIASALGAVSVQVDEGIRGSWGGSYSSQVTGNLNASS